MQDWQHGGFGLYLHWPFCAAKCPYCDFNSHVSRSIDHQRWENAFLSEIDRVAEGTSERVLNSVFFGGGTPSLMPPSLVNALLERISDRWTFANDIEVTLEANPSSVEVDNFRSLRAAGVNRVSLGVQALNDRDLQRLGRLHSVADAYSAMDTALSCFNRASFDLIYARQDQTLSDWEKELNTALTRGFRHFSLYQLTIEEGTAFGDRYKAGRLAGLPSDDLSADMYELTLQICEDAGLPYYEISNFAEPDEESRHNLIYWRYGDYVGIGPGAHGRITEASGKKLATEAHRAPGKWLTAVETAGNGTSSSHTLSPSEQADEYTLMNIRLREGLSIDRYQNIGGKTFNAQALQNMVADGIVEITRGQLRVSAPYIPVTNSVIETLLDDRK